MPKLNAILSDVGLERDGVWASLQGIRFRVRHAAGPAFERAYDRIVEPFRREVRAGTATPEQLHEINVAVAAEYIVADWSDMEDEEGRPIPFSPEKAREIFRREDARGVLGFVQVVARDEALFRAKLDSESLGNSARSSTGS